MNKITILLLIIFSFGMTIEIGAPKTKRSAPEDVKAYGTINFGDGKKYIETKLKELINK